jgi:hypothetical protein
MSYHLRQLAEYGFVNEVPGRGQGREQWWQAAAERLWIPREGLSPEAQAEASGLKPPPGLAEELEGFERFRAARGAMDEWGRGTWAVMRSRLTLTREEAARLIGRYQREAADAPDGARTVVLGFLAYPEPPRDTPGGPGEDAGGDS